MGFVLRLAARLPFLFIAGRIYGPDIVGRYAIAVLVIEFAALVATLGLKRGLAQALSVTDRPESHVVWDAMVVAFIVSGIAAGVLIALPEIMFPNSPIGGLDRLLGLAVFATAWSDVSLAALAYRDNVRASVNARAIVEPWTISLAAWGFSYVSTRDGLLFAYLLSMSAAFVASIVPFLRSYGLPWGWKPRLVELAALARRNAPLAGADAIEWLTRNIDRFVVGLLFAPAVVGVYYMAQQVTSVPQKLKTSFDPVLGPGIARSLARGDRPGVAAQVRQVGFWIMAAQGAMAVAAGVPAEGLMGLVGPEFVAGAGALVILLVGEVAASTGSVCEAGLVYIARHRNLMISMAMLGVQVALSFVFVLAARALGLPLYWQAAGPALALTLTLSLSSIIKARMLSRMLGASVSGLRWPFLLAVVVSGLVGAAFTSLPHQYEWAELSLGIPAILITYSFVIVKWAFGPEDRTLFRKLPNSGPTPRDAEPIATP